MTILTPFGRMENKYLMISHVERQNVRWVVMTDRDTDFPPWVEVHKSTILPGELPAHSMLKHYMENHLQDEEQYIFLADDDFVEEGFFRKIPNVDVAIVSMKRGQHQVKTADVIGSYPCNTLIAKPENMRVGHVGHEQLIIKGKILRKYRVDPKNSVADGVLIEAVVRQEKAVYVPDAYVLFNYLQDGRWDTFNRRPQWQ